MEETEGQIVELAERTIEIILPEQLLENSVRCHLFAYPFFSDNSFTEFSL